MKCEMIGILNDEKYRKMSDISRRVYSPDAIAPSIHTCGGGNTEPKIAEIRCIEIPLETKVKLRKYDVDIKGLQHLLRTHKKYTNRDISERLQRPLTEVEHWFRTDKYFSIPSEDIWFPLKDLLEIETDEYDKPITEFISADSVYDIANRAYHENGLSPTITSQQVSKIAECVGGFGNKWGDKQYHQQNKIYKGDIALAHPSNISGGSYHYMMETDMKSCALRTRNYAGIPQRLEIGGENANSITSAQKDSMVIAYDEQNKKLRTDGTVGNDSSDGSSPKHNNRVVLNMEEPNFRIRKLTPKECWRLMGFDDTDFENAADVNSNTQLYKQAGNSIVVDVLECIFGEML